MQQKYKKKINIVFVFILFLLFIFTYQVFSYDNKTTHPKLTAAIIELYNSQSPEIKIKPVEAEWIIKGSIEEDEPATRCYNHFYDPSTGKGLSNGKYKFIPGTPAPDWALNPAKQNFYLFAGDYSWQRAIYSYQQGDYKRAFISLGHILHLLEDMAVPAHTRNDAHERGDPYEKWASKNNQQIKVNLKDLQKQECNSLKDCFHKLATYSHNNFFSKDTIPSYIYNRPYKGEYIYKNNIKLLFWNPEKQKYVLDHYIIHDNYWNHLAPQAVGYGARLIEIFFKEANKDKIPEPQSFLGYSWQYIREVPARTFNDIKGSAILLTSLFKKDNKNSSIAEINNQRPNKTNNKGIKQDNQSQPTKEKYTESKPEVLGYETQAQDPQNKSKITQSKTSKNKQNSKNKSSQNSQTITQSIKKQNSQNKTPEITTNIGIAYVIDGDTIILTNGEKVRYIGIDTPELKKPGPDDDECLAWVARLRNMQLLSKGNFYLVKDPNADRDKYGRLLRYVYAGGIFINEQLAREGLAKTFFCPPHQKNCPQTIDETRKNLILAANKYARKNHLGLYSDVCKSKKTAKKKEEKNQTQKANKNIDTNKEQKETIKQDLAAPTYIFFSHGPAPQKEQKDRNKENNKVDNIQDNFEQISNLTATNLYTDISSSSLDISSSTKEAVFYGRSTSSPPNSITASSTISSTTPLVLGTSTVSLDQSCQAITSSTKLNLTITQMPLHITNSSTTNFSIECNIPEAKIICQIDNIAIPECKLKSISLDDGYHTFFAKAEFCGLIATTSYDWKIDTVPPQSEIIKVSLTNIDIFDLSWQGSDNLSQIKQYDLYYKIGNYDWSILGGIRCSKEHCLFNIPTGNQDHISFKIKAIDWAGNQEDISKKKAVSLSLPEKQLKDNLSVLVHFDELVGYGGFSSHESYYFYKFNTSWCPGYWGCGYFFNNSNNKGVFNFFEYPQLSTRKRFNIFNFYHSIQEFTFSFYLKKQRQAEATLMFVGESSRQNKYNFFGINITDNNILLCSNNSCREEIDLHNNYTYFRNIYYESNCFDDKSFKYNFSYQIDSETWHHFVLVGSRKHLKVYINGNLEYEREGDFSLNSKSIFEGILPSENSHFCLDDLAMWGRPLKEEEIKEIYENNLKKPLSPYNPNIFVYSRDKKYQWYFNEGKGDIIYENIHNANFSFASNTIIWDNYLEKTPVATFKNINWQSMEILDDLEGDNFAISFWYKNNNQIKNMPITENYPWHEEKRENFSIIFSNYNYDWYISHFYNEPLFMESVDLLDHLCYDEEPHDIIGINLKNNFSLEIVLNDNKIEKYVLPYDNAWHYFVLTTYLGNGMSGIEIYLDGKLIYYSLYNKIKNDIEHNMIKKVNRFYLIPYAKNIKTLKISSVGSFSLYKLTWWRQRLSHLQIISLMNYDLCEARGESCGKVEKEK